MTTAETLRSKATGLDVRIRRCLGPPHHQDERTQHEGYVLTVVQSVLRKLADAHDEGKCPAAVADWRDVTLVENAVRVLRNVERGIGREDRLSDEQGSIRSLLTDQGRQ